MKIKLYSPAYFIALASSVTTMEVKAIEFHRLIIGSLLSDHVSLCLATCVQHTSYKSPGSVFFRHCLSFFVPHFASCSESVSGVLSELGYVCLAHTT